MINPEFISQYSVIVPKIPNIFYIIDRIHTDMIVLNDTTVSMPDPSNLTAIHQRVLKFLDEITNEMNGHGYCIDDLSTRTQRALKWLGWISIKENFTHHVNTLSKLYEIHRSKRSHLLLKIHPRQTLRLTIYNISPLFRTKIQPGQIISTVHPGFCSASTPVLESLYNEIAGKGTQVDRRLIRTYALNESFQTTYRALLVNFRRPLRSTSGECYDLKKILKNVNQQFFQNILTTPCITWSLRRTYRIFGRYDPKTDTIMISKTLDNGKVPEYVLEYVIFHELLHKKVGTFTRNNRHYSHTVLFRKMEKLFPRLNEANAILKSLSKRDIQSL
jgi:hypothetical protein